MAEIQNLVILQTKCTNCRASFNVTQEQLQAHKGLVRCGKCKEVFQAKENIRVLSEQEIAIEKLRYQQQLEQQKLHEQQIQQQKQREQLIQQNIKIQTSLQSDGQQNNIISTNSNFDQATKQKIALAQMQLMLDQAGSSEKKSKNNTMRWVMGIFIISLVASAMLAPTIIKSFAGKKTKENTSTNTINTPQNKPITKQNNNNIQEINNTSNLNNQINSNNVDNSNNQNNPDNPNNIDNPNNQNSSNNPKIESINAM